MSIYYYKHMHFFNYIFLEEVYKNSLNILKGIKFSINGPYKNKKHLSAGKNIQVSST